MTDRDTGNQHGRTVPGEQDNWSEPANTIVRILGSSVKPQTMGANSAFPLQGKDKVWLVLDGHIDIFSLADGPTESSKGFSGMRHFVARVPAGGLVFGSIGEGATFDMLAVPSNGAVVVETTRPTIRKGAVGAKGVFEALTRGINDWTNAISAAMAQRFHLHDVQKISADETVTAPAGTTMVAKSDPLWIDAEAGQFTMPDGSPVAVAGDGKTRLLVTKFLAITSAVDVEFKPMSMTQFLALPSSHEDVDLLHDRMLELATTKIAKRRQAELEEAEQKKEFDRLTFGVALRRLSGVLFPKTAEVAAVSTDPLMAAASLVCAENQIKLDLSTASQKRIRDSEDSVDSLASESGLRVRRVRLADEWWTEDHGPILAFIGDEKKPCALLTDTPRSYRLADPQAAGETRVTRDIAKTVDETAYAFYAPFPPGKIGPWQLLKFSFHGAGRDGLMIAALIVTSGFLSLGLPIVTGWIMDPVIPDAEFDLLTVLIIALVVLGISMTTFSLVQSIAMLRVPRAEWTTRHRRRSGIGCSTSRHRFFAPIRWAI